MDANEFDALQSYTHDRLPAEYLEVHRNYPFSSESRNASLALWKSLGDILAWNDELREGEHAADWNSHWFAMGLSPVGDTFFLDLTEGSTRVYCWDHETHDVYEMAESLGAFVETVSQWDAAAALTEAQRVWQADQARRIRVGLWVVAAILIACALAPLLLGLLLVRS